MTLYIPVIIQQKETMAVVDTAAQVSVISWNFYYTLISKPKLVDTIILRGAGEFSEMNASVTDKIELKIGKSSLQWSMIVADITDNVILGIDFLIHQKAVINLADYTVQLHGQIIPSIMVSTKEKKKMKIFRVKLAEKIVIPPCSNKLSSVEFDEIPSTDTVIQPTNFLKGLLIPNMICQGKKQVPIVLKNLSNVYKTLRKGYPIGIGIEASETIEDDEEEMDFKINKIDVENQFLPEIEQLEKLEKQLPDHIKELFTRSICNLDTRQSIQLAKLLYNFADIFAKDDLDIGLFNGNITHRIDTQDAHPVKQRMRRTPLGFEKEEEVHLQDLLEKGIVEPSSSDWASPPVLVRKKDGKLRYCIDYRKLNNLTVKDAFPIPKIETCLDTLRGSVFMSTLDMASGYYQVKLDDHDKHKTAFITKYGLFQYTKLPFGLCNSPATFSRMIQLVLQGLTWKECLAYLDDVVVLGTDFDSHMENLYKVFSRFRKYNLKLKPSKCNLLQTQVKFLGKIVSENGIAVNPDSIEAVKKWPIPKGKKDVESFLGFSNYHRDHIKNFAEIAEPLHQLTGQKTDFAWHEKHQQAFEQLKEALLNAVILSFPTPDDIFILDTDASEKTIGAELSQVQNGVEKTISYASRVLTPTQRKYCTTRKELLAIVCFTRHFRHYLLGRNFIIRTDHNSLTWLLNFKNIEGQLARWIEELSQYNMVIQHRSGKKHSNADGLSRIPDDLVACNDYKAGVNLEDLPCGGCAFCTRARRQWGTFEEDVDFVVPLAIRRLAPEVVQSNWLCSYSPQELLEEQLKDPDLKTLKDWTIQKHIPSVPELKLSSKAVRHFWLCNSQLELKDEVLYYRWEDPVCPKLLFMAPKQMQPEILHYCHDIRMSGHMGQYKTLEKVKNMAIWYGMTQDCKLYVQSCQVCNKNKKLTRKARAGLEQYHAGVPMERVHMDILGPLPVTQQGSRYILMVVDQFTKWLECFPISSQTAEIVARTLVDNFFSRFGCPLELHTDQGKNMDGNLIRQLCELMQIAKTRTTPYHPSSNGQIERYNRTLLQIIRCFIKNKQYNWDLHLQQLVAAVRSTRNRQTGFTPNLMMLGREVFQPVDVLFGMAKVQSEEKEVPQYILDLVETMNMAHSIARDNLDTAQERQKRTYDLVNNQNSYDVGDVVYKLDQATKVGQSSKLKSPWKGPYVITELKRPVLYKIKDRKCESWIHHDRIKLCQDREFPVWIKRLRNEILKCSSNLKETDDPNENFNMSSLFNENTADVSTSDLLVSHIGSDSNVMGAPDLLVSNDIIQEMTRSMEARKTVNNLDELKDLSENLDDTFMYHIDNEQGTITNSLEINGKRNRKRPFYLKDYIED